MVLRTARWSAHVRHSPNPPAFGAAHAGSYVQGPPRQVPGFDGLHRMMSLLLAERVPADGRILVLGAGGGLEIKSLMLFLVATVILSLLVVGPRGMFRSRWFWLGGALALGLWLPNLIWQATNDWPQLTLSREIASGGSGTSMPRWVFLPFQILLVSPVLAPIWITGLVRLFRDRALRPWRALALAWVLLAAIYIITAGKPYYLAGMFPVLLAAGAEPVLAWARRWASSRRTFGVAATRRRRRRWPSSSSGASSSSRCAR